MAIDGGTVVVGAYYKDDAGGAWSAGLRLPHDGRRRHVRPGGQADGFRCSGLRPIRHIRGHRRRHHRGRRLRRQLHRAAPGAVYVFRTTDGGATYSQVAKLTASDAASQDYFGCSVAIDGDTVVVGAYYDDDGTPAEAAYVFRTTDGGATYGQVAKLTASDAASGDELGRSVAIDGGTVVVGAYGNPTRPARAYVFRTTDGGATYGQVAKLTAADAAAGDYFGGRVAIDGDTVVVGAYKTTTPARPTSSRCKRADVPADDCRPPPDTPALS